MGFVVATAVVAVAMASLLFVLANAGRAPGGRAGEEVWRMAVLAPAVARSVLVLGIPALLLLPVAYLTRRWRFRMALVPAFYLLLIAVDSRPLQRWALGPVLYTPRDRHVVPLLIGLLVGTTYYLVLRRREQRARSAAQFTTRIDA